MRSLTIPFYFKTVSFAIICTFFFLAPISNWDIWWHLDSGRWMLEQGAILDHEIRSFTADNAPWINFAWLYQCFLALFYRMGGDHGLMAFKVLLLFGLFLVISMTSLRDRNRLFPLMLTLLIVSFPLSGFLMLRPHLLAFFYLSLLVYLISKPFQRSHLPVFGALLLIWANTHASAIVGVTATGIHLFLDSEARRFMPNHLMRGMVAMSGVAILFCTPFSWDILTVLMAHGGKENVFYINEWKPPVVFSTLLFSLVVLYWGSLLLKQDRFRPAEAFLVVFFLYFALRHSRFAGDLAILMIRPATHLFSHAFQKLFLLGKRVPALAFLLLIVSLSQLYRPPLARSLVTPDLFPIAYAQYPTETSRVLRQVSEEERRPLRLLNLYRFGGYVEWALQEEVAVFIDGRTPTIYDKSLLEKNFSAMRHRYAFDVIADHYQIDAFLTGAQEEFFVLSPEDPQWQLVAYDRASLLYLRRSIKSSESLPEIRYNPKKIIIVSPSKEVQEHIPATRKLLKETPRNGWAWFHLGMFLLNDASEKSVAEGILALEKARHLSPRDPVITILLSHYQLENGASVEKVAQQMLSLDDKLPGFPAPYLENMAADVFLRLGRPRAALHYLSPGQPSARAKLDLEFYSWINRGKAYAVLRQKDEADSALVRARMLSKPGHEDHEHELTMLQKIIRKYVSVPDVPGNISR